MTKPNAWVLPCYWELVCICGVQMTSHQASNIMYSCNQDCFWYTQNYTVIYAKCLLVSDIKVVLTYIPYKNK